MQGNKWSVVRQLGINRFLHEILMIKEPWNLTGTKAKVATYKQECQS